MTPRLAETIDVARALAWLPVANLVGIRFHERREIHRHLVRLVGRRLDVRVGSPPELRFLVAAIRRVARCSFANRRGEPYYARRQALLELRGCLEAYDRAAAE